MLFGELCALLNVHIDPDADYVEDDFAREHLISSLLKSVKESELSVLALSNDIYYLGLTVDICRTYFPPVMTTREMNERVATCSIHFRRELKKVGLFKHLDRKEVRLPDPVIIQCDCTYPITA